MRAGEIYQYIHSGSMRGSQNHKDFYTHMFVKLRQYELGKSSYLCDGYAYVYYPETNEWEFIHEYEDLISTYILNSMYKKADKLPIASI